MLDQKRVRSVRRQFGRLILSDHRSPRLMQALYSMQRASYKSAAARRVNVLGTRCRAKHLKPPPTPLCCLFPHTTSPLSIPIYPIISSRLHHVCLQARYVHVILTVWTAFWHLCALLHVVTVANSRAPDGRKERVQFDKITARVSRLCYGLDPDHVDPAAITMKVISGVYQGVTTIQLDDLVRHYERVCTSRGLTKARPLRQQHT